MFLAKVDSVERAMRHSLESAYFKNTLKNINTLIGFEYLSPYEKPSLTHFISLLAERHIILTNKIKDPVNNTLEPVISLTMPDTTNSDSSK